MKRKADSASVYFVQAGADNGPVKIGFTGDLKKRLESLQNGSPDRLTVLHEMKCTTVASARGFEQTFHGLFDDLRIEGRKSEWFRWHRDIGALVEKLKAFEATFFGSGIAARTCIHRLHSGIVMDPSPDMHNERIDKVKRIVDGVGGQVAVTELDERAELQIKIPIGSEHIWPDINRTLGQYRERRIRVGGAPGGRYLNNLYRLLIQSGEVRHVSVRHDSWCNMMTSGGQCDCDPEIGLLDGPPESYGASP